MAEFGHRWLLTGGIGSGKSEVRRLLDQRGIATIDSDALGHLVLEPEGPAFAPVSQTWPETVENGHIDRSLLAAIVFADPGQLARLEGLTHPLIFGMIEETLQGITGPVVVEVPLAKPQLSGMWSRAVVDCADDLRLGRLVGRGMSSGQALERMAVQPAREEWLASADLVIPNHGTLGDLTASVAVAFNHIAGS